MQDILELIQTIARQRGRGDSGPLILLRTIDGTPGERVSHLPIENDFAQAWLALLSEPFRPHQAQVIAALRRGEPTALLASNPRVATTAYLCMYAVLTQLGASAIILAPDAYAAHAARARLTYINENLPATYRLSLHYVEPNVRPDPYARLVIATPESLHARLLRHHDRAWNVSWPRIKLMAILDLQRYHGVAGAHLGDMLVRTQRIALAQAGNPIPHMLATGWEVSEPQTALSAIYNGPWRVISGDDLPTAPTALAAWRGTTDRLRESVEVARAIQKQGYHVHILCQPLEVAILEPMLGDAPDITLGSVAQSAHVLICAGYPGSQSHLRRLARSSYQAVLVVLGDAPHEQMLARHTETLISAGPSAWPAPTLNAYVTAQHLLCAASELPLTEEEVDRSGTRDTVDRLVNADQLIDLPDPEVAWKPGPKAGDPYSEFSLISASGGAAHVRYEQSNRHDQLDPSGFERWDYANAALPALRGGLRVTNSDDDTTTLTVRAESNNRRSIALRRCTLTVREEREQRALYLSNKIGFGRAVVEEEISGNRELVPPSAASEQPMRSTLHTRWSAPCCWFDLTTTPQPNGQLIGWSLAAALEFQTLAALTDIVPCYVAEQRRLYFVDAQPGGNGLAAWLYHHAEDLLPVAYDIALACRNDALLEPIARTDMDWLLPLLGRRSEGVIAPTMPQATEAPRLILLPAPEPVPVPRTVVPAPPPSRAEPASTEEAPRRSSGRETNNAEQRTPTQRQPPPQAPPAPPAPSPISQQSLAFEPPPRQPPERVAPSNPERPVERRPPSSPPEPAAPDANALIERLRRQREQREAKSNHTAPAPQRTSSAANIVLRFKPGDKVFCLPYGDGLVRASRAVDERELLTVAFPDFGELEIDPAVSLVRKLEDAPEEDDLL